MAITITAAALAAALRLSDTDEELAEATRLLGYAAEAIEKYLGAAFASTPDVVVNEVTIRVAGFLFDAPFAARKDTVANAMRSSGAARMMLPYVIHGAGVTGALDAAQAAVGSSGNPVVGVAVEDGNLVVTFADGTTDTLELPAGGGGSVATNVADGRLPAPAVAARLGWSQTRDASAVVFTRADNHPEDGAAVGTTDAVEAPPFPPALTGDATLYLHWWVAGSVAVAAFLEGLGTDPIDYTDFFESLGDLTIDGQAGIVHISTFRFNPLVGSIFRAVLPGALILTDDAVEDWAKTMDATLIPADKLTNAPGGSGGGLDEGDVDLRVEAGVADWAETGDTSPIPVAKLSEVPPSGLDEGAVDARVGTLVEEWARLTGSTDLIPFDKLANKPTISLVVPPNPSPDDLWIQVITNSLTEHTVVLQRRNQENDAWVERFSFRTNPAFAWAERANTDLIPADKLTNAPGQTETQVDARVAAGVSDWAEEGDTSSIPLTKLGNAPSASSWFWAASVFGPFVAGVAEAMTLRSFPIGPWADYAAMRAAVMDGSVKTIALGLFENDANDADGDHSITVVPNISALRASPGTFDAFPNWALSVDPVRFRVVFAETAPTAAADAAIPASPTFFVRVVLQV